MPITQAQRVEIGAWYVSEIKRRIGVRNAEAGRVQVAQAEKEREGVLRSYGERVAKAHKLGTVTGVSESNERIGADYEKGIRVYTADATLTIKIDAVAGLRSELARATRPIEVAKDRCREVEFLTSVTTRAAIAGFQSYVATLATDKPAEAALKTMLDDYLTSRRPAVCKIA